jgi:hypothetical protein
MNLVCKELELAGSIESSVAVAVVLVLKVAVFVLVLVATAVAAAVAAAVIGVRNCAGLANTRTNSVCKGLGPVGALEKRAHRSLSRSDRLTLFAFVTDATG